MLSKIILEKLAELPYELQAKSLSIFFHNNHNNRYIDNIMANNRALFVYQDFERSCKNFSEMLPKDNFRRAIYNVITTIEKVHELSRLFAIICHHNKELSESSKTFELAIKAWAKSGSQDLSYPFIIFKTQVDLFLKDGNYGMAKDILEQNITMVELLEDSSWLVYQYKAALVACLSKMEDDNKNYISILNEEMEQHKEDAEWEDHFANLNTKNTNED